MLSKLLIAALAGMALASNNTNTNTTADSSSSSSSATTADSSSSSSSATAGTTSSSSSSSTDAATTSSSSSSDTAGAQPNVTTVTPASSSSSSDTPTNAPTSSSSSSDTPTNAPTSSSSVATTDPPAGSSPTTDPPAGSSPTTEPAGGSSPTTEPTPTTKLEVTTVDANATTDAAATEAPFFEAVSDFETPVEGLPANISGAVKKAAEEAFVDPSEKALEIKLVPALASSVKVTKTTLTLSSRRELKEGRELTTATFKLKVDYKAKLNNADAATGTAIKNAIETDGTGSFAETLKTEITSRETEMKAAIPGFDKTAIVVKKAVSKAVTPVTVPTITSGTLTIMYYDDASCTTPYSGTDQGPTTHTYPLGTCKASMKTGSTDQVFASKCGFKAHYAAEATCDLSKAKNPPHSSTLGVCYGNSAPYSKMTCSSGSGSTSSASSTGLSVAAAGMAAVAATLIM